MSTWRLAPALIQLRDELNGRWPNRDKSSDGAIGDAAHAASASDHNPNSEGVVCAYDIDTDLDGTNDSNDPEMEALVEWLRTHPHPNLKYVIFQGRMFSSYATSGYAPFAWRPYHGDAHVSHPHVSVGKGKDGRSAPGTYNDTSPWLAGFGGTDQEDDPFMGLTDEELGQLATMPIHVAAVEQTVARLETDLKSFFGPDGSGADERVAFFDSKNGLYSKVTALQTDMSEVKATLAKLLAKLGA
jgi:hypothetical protein